MGNLFYQNVYDVTANGKQWTRWRNYKREEKHIDVSVKQIEEGIAKLNYTGNNLKKDKVTQDASFPYFMPVMIDAWFQEQRIISQEELWINYAKEYLIFSPDGKYCHVQNGEQLHDTQAMIGRIYRTYPSFVRDIHCYQLLCESNWFDKVEYSLRKDIYDGIDIGLWKNGVFFGLSLYVSTKDSHNYKEQKDAIRPFRKHIDIRVPVCLEECTTLGNLGVMNQSHLNYIVEQVNVHLDTISKEKAQPFVRKSSTELNL